VEDYFKGAKRRQLISRITKFLNLDANEISFLSAQANGPHMFRRGEPLFHAGRTCKMYLVVHGWVSTEIISAAGYRQVTSINLPGDMIGLSNLAFKHAAESAAAITDVIAQPLSEAFLTEVFKSYPRLAAAIFLISQEERVAKSEWLALMGRADARTKLSAFLIRLADRIGENTDAKQEFDFPLSQRDLADIIGISTVHMNSVVQDLRKEEIAVISHGKISIDRPKLEKIANLASRTIQKASWVPSST